MGGNQTCTVRRMHDGWWRPLYSIGLAAALVGCQAEDVNEIRSERILLRAQRDTLQAALAKAQAHILELEQGPDRLLAVAQRLAADNNFVAAADTAALLIKRFPEMPAAAEAERIRARALATIEKAELVRHDSLVREEKASAARRERALAGLVRVRDGVEGSTTYYPRFAGQYVNGRSALFLRITQRDGGTPILTFGIRYVADEWLFIERYIVNVDGRNYEIDASGSGGVQRDNGGGEIYEWYNSVYGTAEQQIVNAILQGKSATLRYVGSQYKKDRTITQAEKADLQRVLDARETLSATGR